MLFARLTEQEWYHLFDTIQFGSKFISLSKIEDIEEIEQNQFGIKIVCYETNSNVYKILDKGKFFLACLKAGINPKTTTEEI